MLSHLNVAQILKYDVEYMKNGPHRQIMKKQIIGLTLILLYNFGKPKDGNYLGG